MMKRLIVVLLCLSLALGCLSGCDGGRELVIIYTSAEDYRVEYMWQRLLEEFPEYEIIIEYLPTGNHAAKLLAEGPDTECDITYDLEYSYLDRLEREGLLADLSGYDYSVFVPDVCPSRRYMPTYRNGGAVIINPRVLAQYGLEAPDSYADLLDPRYKGLISMPNPTSSGTGYMFLLALVNAWGEAEAFAYFDALQENILQFTASGSGPVNALRQGEAAIGLGITGNAVTAINEGARLEIRFFDEGAPYALYGQGIIAGRETRPAVREVYDFLYHTFAYENCALFYPEPIFSGETFAVENYPRDIVYCDMSGDTPQRKEELLSKWKY